MAYAPEYNAQTLRINEIFIVGERRPLNEDAVEQIKKSIFGENGKKGIGLQTPIVVRGDDNLPDPDTGEPGFSAWVLVSGHHRLEAYKRQGEEYIPAIVRDWDVTEAELWEISENLHRADLTAEQRRECIRRYAELLLIRDGDKLQPLAAVSPTGGRGKKGVITRVAEETGVHRETVRRALNPEVAERHKQTDAIRRQRAKEALAAAQVLTKTDATADQQEPSQAPSRENLESTLADLMASYIAPEHWPSIQAMLPVIKPSKLAAEFEKHIAKLGAAA